MENQFWSNSDKARLVVLWCVVSCLEGYVSGGCCVPGVDGYSVVVGCVAA